MVLSANVYLRKSRMCPALFAEVGMVESDVDKAEDGEQLDKLALFVIIVNDKPELERIDEDKDQRCL